MIAATSVVRQPALLPHAMPDAGTIEFRRITAAAVRQASFLDGRVPVGEPAGACSISELLVALRHTPDPGPLPMIFHVSFCGSTLLSRLLDVPGHALVYREPAIQIALADRHAAGLRVGDALAVSTALLGRPVDGAAAIVKPTNWANVLLPVWADGGAIVPIFITMRPRAFLTAVFRGGRDRMAFTIRAAEHFAKVFPEGPEIIAAAVRADREPLAQAARLALVALELQLRLFSATRERFGVGGGCTLDERDIRRNPVAAAQHAAAGLGLDRLAPLIAGRDMTAHAKDPGQRFSRTAEKRADRTVGAQYGSLFDAALGWAARRNAIAMDGSY